MPNSWNEIYGVALNWDNINDLVLDRYMVALYLACKERLNAMIIATGYNPDTQYSPIIASIYDIGKSIDNDLYGMTAGNKYMDAYYSYWHDWTVYPESDMLAYPKLYPDSDNYWRNSKAVLSQSRILSIIGDSEWLLFPNKITPIIESINWMLQKKKVINLMRVFIEHKYGNRDGLFEKSAISGVSWGDCEDKFNSSSWIPNTINNSDMSIYESRYNSNPLYWTKTARKYEKQLNPFLDSLEAYWATYIYITGETYNFEQIENLNSIGHTNKSNSGTGNHIKLQSFSSDSVFIGKNDPQPKVYRHCISNPNLIFNYFNFTGPGGFKFKDW